MDDPEGFVSAAVLAKAVALVETLRNAGLTVATSESLTGGLVGAVITSVPGASVVYLGGVVVYATPMKVVLSGASPETLALQGAISQATARELATGIRERTGADWAIATTGAAGPDSQEGHAPGEVWIGIAGPGVVRAQFHRFTGDRAAVREQAARAAITFLAGAIA